MVAYRAGAPISARQFLSDVRRAAGSLPPATHILNGCTDRYQFAVSLAAALLSGRVSLLPSSQAPEMLRRLARFAPDVLSLADEGGRGEAHQTEVPQIDVPQIDESRLLAYVFTSGSTGSPLPYPKTFGCMVRCVHEQARRLGLSGEARWALLATVPPQHMYGLEASVRLPLATGHALCAERPFYPADVSAALERLPRLVT